MEYCAPCFKKVMEERELKAVVSTLKRTAPGPDELPFWISRDYAYQLAPTITKVFKVYYSFLKKQLVPCLWKLANVTPITKETRFETCKQLRPISLTNVIMRLFERVVVKQELSPVLKSAIGSDQFAYKEGCNTTLALLCQISLQITLLPIRVHNVVVLSLNSFYSTFIKKFLVFQ